jgi:hypothetical protein
MKKSEERRQTPRFSYPATAVIRTPEGEEVTDVEVLGLGIAGCRVAISRPLQTDQELELTIKPQGEEIVTSVVVVYWNRNGFAGLHFTTMSAEARERLEHLVDHILRTSGQPEAGASS